MLLGLLIGFVVGANFGLVIFSLVCYKRNSK